MRFLLAFCLFLFVAAPVVQAADRMAEFTRTLEALQKKDYPAAFKILTPLAEGGDTMAMLNIGAIYDGGFGYTPNYPEALKWLTRASDAGLADAQLYLGDKYLEGRGVKVDLAQAVKFYTSAADSGHAPAQVALGRMYAQGKGVAKNDATAVVHFRKAAEQRSIEGAIWVGSAYETGAGVKKDMVQAYMWTKLADTFNKAPDTVEPPHNGIEAILEHQRYNMTKEDVARAEKLAADWQPGAK